VYCKKEACKVYAFATVHSRVKAKLDEKKTVSCNLIKKIVELRED
jgi:hypothetical protein